MTESTWTNSAIRKRLGESGFIELRDRQENYTHVRNSYWQRGNSTLLLIEHVDEEGNAGNEAPTLVDSYGKFIDPTELGVRNENTQTGNFP